MKLRGSLIREMPGWVASGPEEAQTCQYCQMARAEVSKMKRYTRVTGVITSL